MTALTKVATIDVFGGQTYYRSTRIKSGGETLLFLHGLGESGLSFGEAFQEPSLRGFNVLVPDLVGFGKSSAAVKGGYSFSSQIRRIIELLDALEIGNFHLIGHSMGGDIGTELADRHSARVKTFVNVEGDLTPGDRFITNEARKAEKEGRFHKWFHDDFPNKIVADWAKKRMSCRRYLLSLSSCRAEAFLESAEEIYRLNAATPESESKIGIKYNSLSVPKVFCWGMESLSEESQGFLTRKELTNRAFEGSGHWVMQDRREAFYNFLSGFLAGYRM